METITDDGASHEISYRTRHRHVAAARGKAADAGSCADCGGPAEEWSQIHGTDGLSPAGYEPRCIPCHNRYDGKGRLGPRVVSDGPRFDPEGPQLVYMAIADEIAGQIDRGELQSGDRLLSEAALAEEFGAARMTVSRAIRELRERGLVHTVIGKGTYVS